MYQEFLVSEIISDMRKKQITVKFSHDIDSSSIDESTLQIIHRKTRDFVDYNIHVEGKVVSITLLEWPLPNQEYILKIEKFKNILGDTLVSGIRRKIIFKSSICSTIDITSPAFNEVIDELIVKWVENKTDETHELVNSFYLEISPEANFYNISYKTLVTDKQAVELPALKAGQYYIRCRAQKEEQYGFWSETITFLIDKTPAKPEAIFDSEEDDDEPIFLEDIKILSTPKSGETPSSILIEFDCEIDSDFLDNIILIRREY